MNLKGIKETPKIKIERVRKKKGTNERRVANERFVTRQREAVGAETGAVVGGCSGGERVRRATLA